MLRFRELLDLADDKSRSCAAVGALARTDLAEVERKIDLLALHGELDRMLATCDQGTVSDCRVIETLAKDAIQ
ncbi:MULTISPECIES: MerR family DNA-binding protein [Sphingomonadales]|jgi:hypothetical protein|uniref:MerR family DNA-binding protein n=3 Tax=Sphingomonadales TaxID=204457 RepID=A0A217EZ69_9SPHN|nr:MULTISPECIES: MerR family DNA-binding protein [Sphingomonadales]MDF1835604.1 MerR family DNA-binding protein [Alteraurantiacibacter sp. bin_em_oilr2.035]HAD16124.1 hypothetical protein [Erythrobacter sp.]ARU18440.1 hypothetical protein A9D14_19145 [Croceicoccus marinus]MDP4540497.1 MerR family DNA-binding protein [Qipengyuania sp. DY56-A-20]NYH96668.1 hypothetical protein [Novosphingobium marinum]|tara:strand:+ start:29798 stop:30016 length:219 start_codon:yes stop_codon:yes gene_type:complete